MSARFFFKKAVVPPVEAEYRQHYLQDDIKHTTTGISYWCLACVGLSAIDFLFFGLSIVFLLMFALRFFYVLSSIVMIYILKKRTTHFEKFDLIILFWLVTCILINLGVILFQPRDYYVGVLIGLVGVFSLYFFILNPLLVRFIPALLLSIGELLILWFYKIDVPLVMREMATFAFAATNLVGYFFSDHLNNIRRQEFTARREGEIIRAELQLLASTDPLTGVYNRRKLLELAGEAFYRFRRYQRPVSILVMDLDGFKMVNDTLGHQQGDNVLIQFAEAVDKEKREADALGRMGGDEFCLVLPETLPEASAALAERIIQLCDGIQPKGQVQQLRVSVSVGITQARPGDTNLDALFSRADAALYQAKHSGRNAWRIA